MGEAKRRKANDPNFGRISKNPPSRGLVMSPPMEIDGANLFVKTSSLDPGELRFALLFWDELVWPSSRIVHFGSGPDEQFLEQEGLLKRPEYSFPGSVAESIAKTQIQAFLDLDKSRPGAWALAQGETSLLLRDNTFQNFFQNEGGASVELLRAIPVPQRDVPLAEILEFKARRNSELLALRAHLDSLTEEIAESEGHSEALQKKIAEVDRACANLLELGKEWQSPVYVSDFKLSLSINAGGLLTAGSWLLNFNLDATTAAVLAAATVQIKPDFKFRSPKRPPSPYKYAYHAHNELR